MKQQTIEFASVGLTLTAVTALGASALLTAQFSNMPATPFDGTAARYVEDKINESYPLRDTSRHLWTALQLSLFGDLDSGAVIGAENWLFTQEEFEAAAIQEDFQSELSVAAQALAEFGSTLVVAIVPDKARVYADHLPAARSAPIEARYDRLLAQAHALGVQTVDLREALQEGRSTAPTFMRTDTHWSPWGAQLAAAETASAVRLHAYTSAEFETTQTDLVAFAGDLMKFTDTGQFSWLADFPGETIAVYDTVSTEDAGLSLFGAPQVDIALVGTSYSARKDFHFDGFLRSALGADLINYAEEGLGPVQPMTQFLGSSDLRDAPPALVIWEIPERYVY